MRTRSDLVPGGWDELVAEVERLRAENRGHLANNENLAGACKQYERRAVVAEAKIKAALALLESSDPPVYGLVVKALRGE